MQPHHGDGAACRYQLRSLLSQVLLEKIYCSSPGILGRFRIIAISVRVVVERVFRPGVGLNINDFPAFCIAAFNGSTPGMMFGSSSA